jgi:F-type H+-transporting ATPase subunit b
MRKRLLLLVAIAALFGALVLAAMPGSASAAPAPSGAPAASVPSQNKFDKECRDKLNHGGTLDECHQAPSPILPASNELFYGSIAFVVLFLALWKFAWPGLQKGMESRTDKIREGLEEAEQAKTDATNLRDDYQRRLADARSEAARIIEEARQSGDTLRRDLETRAEADIAEQRRRADADIAASQAQALAELRGQVAELAVGAAEQVVGRSLDRDTNTAIVENFIDTVGATS